MHRYPSAANTLPPRPAPTHTQYSYARPSHGFAHASRARRAALGDPRLSARDAGFALVLPAAPLCAEGVLLASLEADVFRRAGKLPRPVQGHPDGLCVFLFRDDDDRMQAVAGLHEVFCSAISVGKSNTALSKSKPYASTRVW